MAYIKKTQNVDTTKTSNSKSNVKESVKDTVKESVKEVKKERVFNDTDLIPCRSIISGALYLTGMRSKIPYTWADYNDVQGVEYRDLIYMVRTSGNKFIYAPRIIIEDEDFISQNKVLETLYNSMYTTVDLREIVKLPVKSMVDEINKLPSGAKDAFKGIVSSMIYSHELDSVQKIKAIDELFGTKLLLTLAQE